MSLGHDNVGVIYISVTRDIHGSSILDVDDCSVVILEELEPSSVGVVDLEIG
jgi:hypothetical protein